MLLLTEGVNMKDGESITAYFITTGNGTENDEAAIRCLANAKNCLKDHLAADRIHELKDGDGKRLLNTRDLTKTDVFVFDRFRGEFFKQVCTRKCLVLGAPCLLYCLNNDLPIPSGCTPVYNVVMQNLQISVSGVSSQEKEQLRQLILWMGGKYFPNFSQSATHLVSNTIKSAKYEFAASSGIPVMHVDWVQRVWERSLNNPHQLTIDLETEKYKLPIFFALNITCTGLSSVKKNEMKRLVEENGGIYHRAFKSQIIDIVITDKEATNTDKFQAAVSYKKEILLPEWILDSVEKGHALPSSKYEVRRLKISTPTKTDQTMADFICPDNTGVSDISHITAPGRKMFKPGCTTLDDTACSNITESVTTTTLQKNTTQTAQKVGRYNYRAVLKAICPRTAKKAGAFLDGCDVYLSGFSLDEREKLNRILNAGGATRYDSVNEKLTHIIVGDIESTETKNLKKHHQTSAQIVRLDWLLECIQCKQPVNEQKHHLSLTELMQPDAPSPSAKKILLSMNHSFKQPEKLVRKKLFSGGMENHANDYSNAHENLELSQNNTMTSTTEAAPLDIDEQNLMAQYSQLTTKPNTVANKMIADDCMELVSTPLASSTQIATRPMPLLKEDIDIFPTLTENRIMSFFQGMSIYVEKKNFSEKFYADILSECEAAGGCTVAANFQDIVDYAIVSVEHSFDLKELPVKAKNVVTELYLENCLADNQIVPIEYYHKHIPETVNSRPLQDMTIVISIYTSFEKDFLTSLAELLGANVNKTYVKMERPLLMCAAPEGLKYGGALKWNYPVVTSQWLLACATEGKRIAFRSYLVGDSVEDFPQSPPPSSSTTTINKGEMPSAKKDDAPPPLLDTINSMTELKEQVHKTNVSPPIQTTDINDNNLENKFTPLRNKRVSELAKGTNMYNYAPHSSPHTPMNDGGGSHSYNFDFMDKILEEIENTAERDTLREVIMEMKLNPTPELERIRRQACTPINRKIPTPKGIPEYCTTPEFQKRMADNFEKRWRLSTRTLKPDTPIEEVRKRVLRATCKAMGIAYNHQLDMNKNETVKSLLNDMEHPDQYVLHSTRSMSNKLSSSSSPPVTKKRQQSSFDGNVLVPNTQSPSKTQVSSLSLGEVNNRRETVEGSTINFDNINFEESFGNSKNDKNNAQEVFDMNPNMMKIQQITDYLQNCEQKRLSLKRLHQSDVANDEMGEKSQVSSSLATTDMNLSGKTKVQVFESEKVDIDGIVEWNDPCDRTTKADDDDDDHHHHHLSNRSLNGSGNGNNGNGKLEPQKMRFSISCSDENTRKDLIIKILHLGGEVCENLDYDASCTHVVCERPNRGQKVFSSISSGKWVLSLKYIDDSFVQEQFLDEEMYEWGNERAVDLPELTTDECAIAQAAYRWRQKIASNIDGKGKEEEGGGQVKKGGGAFTAITAILHLSGRNRDAFKNVITAGGGTVIEAVSPFHVNARTANATHCFVDVKKCSLNRTDYQFLKQNNVLILSQMYINAFLMNGGCHVDLKKYTIQM